MYKPISSFPLVNGFTPVENAWVKIVKIDEARDLVRILMVDVRETFSVERISEDEVRITIAE